MKYLSILFFLFFVFNAHVYTQEQVYETYIEVDGAQLYCKAIGQGEPVIVVHGGPGLMHDYLYKPLLELSENYCVIFYDQRGNGKSTGEISKETINLERFTLDLEAIVQGLNLDKVKLIGHSFGGLLCLKYALKSPNSVDKIVLVNSASVDIKGFSKYLAKSIEFSEKYGGELSEIENSPEFQAEEASALNRYINIAKKNIFYDKDADYEMEIPVTYEALRSFKAIWKIMLAEGLKIRSKYVLDPSYITQPTLIMHGVKDTVPIDSMKEMQKLMTNAYLVPFEKTGHSILIEKNKESISLINEFFNNSF